MNLQNTSDISQQQQHQNQESQTENASGLIRVHVKNSNRGIQDISLEVPSSWRFGQLKRVIATCHSQLVSYSHTQLKFMHAGRIIDDRNTLEDQLKDISQRNATNTYWNMQNQIGQQKQAELSLNLLIEQQVSDNAVELDQKRKILDEKIVMESIWRQYQELIQPFVSITDNEQCQYQERVKTKLWEQQQEQIKQQYPLFHPAYEYNLKTKLQTQIAEAQKKLSDAAALERDQNIQQLQQQLHLQNQIVDRDNFNLTMFLKIGVILAVIVRNFEGPLLFGLLGIAAVYAIVKYKEFKHQQEQRDIRNKILYQNANINNNNNNNPIPVVINNVDNINQLQDNPPPPPAAVNQNDNISQGDNKNNLSSTDPVAEEVTNNNLSEDLGNQNKNLPEITVDSKENNPNIDLQDKLIDTDVSNPLAATKDNIQQLANDSNDLLKNPTQLNGQMQEQQQDNKEINNNDKLEQVADNTQQQTGIPQQKLEGNIPGGIDNANGAVTNDKSTILIKQKRRKPKGILLFILRVKEFIVCLIMSLFPPWHIELYNKGEQYEEENSEEVEEQKQNKENKGQQVQEKQQQGAEPNGERQEGQVEQQLNNNNNPGLLEKIDSYLENKIKELQREKQLIEENLQQIQNSLNKTEQDNQSKANAGLGDIIEGSSKDVIKEEKEEQIVESKNTGLENNQRDQNDIQQEGDNYEEILVDKQTKKNQ